MQDLILEAIEEHKFMLKHENTPAFFMNVPLWQEFLLSKNE